MIFFILNALSLGLSISLVVAIIGFKNNVFSSKMRLENFSKKPIILFLLFLSLYVYRTLCHIKKSLFFLYIFANFTIITAFYFFRVTIVLKDNNIYNSKYYIIFVILFTFSLMMTISRILFKTGYVLNEQPSILFILEPLMKTSQTFFGTLGRRISGNLPVNPNPQGFDRNFALGLGTFFATSTAAAGGVYLCYEAYQGRQVQIQSLQVNQRALDLNERQFDAQERDKGFMSKEDYITKWDQFGKRR